MAKYMTHEHLLKLLTDKDEIAIFDAVLSIASGLNRRYRFEQDADELAWDVAVDTVIKLRSYRAAPGNLFNYVSTLALNSMRQHARKNKLMNERLHNYARHLGENIPAGETFRGERG